MNRKGFTLIETLLLLLILLGLGGTGWYVWDTRNKSIDTLNNADIANNSTIEQDARTAAPQDLSKVSSLRCEYINDANKRVESAKWREKLRATAEIKALEGDRNSKVEYVTQPGSLCELDNNGNLVSFYHAKLTHQADNTVDTDLTYGLLIFDSKGAKVQASTDAKCAQIPPDPQKPLFVSSVSQGKATASCPGYTGAIYSYDITTQTYTKTGQSTPPTCIEGSC